MFGRLILIVVLVPLVELVLLSQLWQTTGPVPALAIVFATGFVGVNLARWQGLSAWQGIRKQLASGQTPSREIMDGVMILFAGAFLMTPGILTDVVGFLLLVPWLRSFLGRQLTRWFLAKAAVSIRTKSGVSPDIVADDEPQPSVRVVEPE